MNKRLLVFGASNSKKSINKQLAQYASQQLNDFTINLIDLNDFEMPIYSIDRENDTGIPDKARLFKSQIESADGIIISFAEHNGSFAAAYKNIYDWTSRLDKQTYHGKPMLMLSTSPGARGGKGVLEHAKSIYGRICPEHVTFSLPSFHQNFNQEKGITEDEHNNQFHLAIKAFREIMEKSGSPN